MDIHSMWDLMYLSFYKDKTTLIFLFGFCGCFWKTSKTNLCVRAQNAHKLCTYAWFIVVLRVFSLLIGRNLLKLSRI